MGELLKKRWLGDHLIAAVGLLVAGAMAALLFVVMLVAEHVDRRAIAREHDLMHAAVEGLKFIRRTDVFGLYAAPRSSVEAAGLIMGGEFTFLFWGIAVVVGILLAISLEVYELITHFISRVVMREHNPWLSGAVTLSVLAGGFVLRYVVVYAGQMAKVVTMRGMEPGLLPIVRSCPLQCSA